MTELYGIDRSELERLLTDEPSFRVDQVWDGLYRQVVPVAEMTNLPATLRDHLASELPTSLTEVMRSVGDDGQTVKWLWELKDGSTVETVLMHYENRSTVCVSSQAGCAMACGFCATGQAGFERHLTSAEIVEQVIRAIVEARPRRVSNVVFMGMGEPMANYDATISAVRRIHGGLGLSARHITISTVGIVPGIDRLTEDELPLNLAVSLHAANDELRDELVPINRRYPLDRLMAACASYLERKNRRLSFEWATIADVNDRHEDALELAGLCRQLRAHVNLIPLNPTPGYGVRGSSKKSLHRFHAQLCDLGVNATIRRNRGTEIDAACGQLRANHEVEVVLGQSPPS
ncbi:MAG: 23S rRNA (adenine(2503)-C(2))-methyltransferase RlmN [Acidimicrobiales bacterium]